MEKYKKEPKDCQKRNPVPVIKYNIFCMFLTFVNINNVHIKKFLDHFYLWIKLNKAVIHSLMVIYRKSCFLAT